MKKYSFWVKRIPDQFQNSLNNQTRFKISLSKCSNNIELKRVKNMLEIKIYYIFDNIDNFNMDSAKRYLKKTIDLTLLQIHQLNEIDNVTIDKACNFTSLETLMNNAIQDKELVHQNKLLELKKDNVDTNIKQKRSSTVAQYKAITNYLYPFFDKHTDLEKINRTKANNFRTFLMDQDVGNNTINTYIKQLRTIFKNFIINNELTLANPFDNFKELIVSKNKKMFSYSEIIHSQKILNNEEYLVFQTILLSGMRFEELCSIKKCNIKNDSFYFNDAKQNFNKVVPIHKDILAQIELMISKLQDNDYLFFPKLIENRVTRLRPNFNKKLKENYDKTLHKTRATFITYLNSFNDGFSDKDIKSLTHKLNGIDDKSYIVTRNLNNLKNIVNSIDLKKLQEIEEQMR